ncbi:MULTISPECIES: secondary thiamine-phosphate synthase enzyme YjbQ [Ignavibacterium]|jgi:secondary thiamine-phosphate synthase enzyme|uniref:secondary thiamine-phosphate synthase enzyme YjbQ n=1 Tax=Ignavibacterium TaxID=795750 RepID=UPI0025BD1E04|nr:MULTISPECIES: secondary thiamine-phosphate synthase enzyme YjbQ [Ignavibacterium]MBI5663086.1 YjbQ family protein [Ignavibacterium album]
MIFIQKEIKLKSRSKGIYLITSEILSEIPEIKDIRSGLVNIFLKHTSASLSLNENASADVRTDMENFLDKLVPNENYFLHNYEGKDDMPAHIKTSLLGNSLTIPVTDGKLNIGTWQGIYLCEHRIHPHRRDVVVTIIGTD